MRLLLVFLMALALPSRAVEPLRIAVAANFRATLESVNARYEQVPGQRIRLSSASTGVLANQLLHGAPFDLFLAADADAPARLRQAEIGKETFCYARGQLALAGGSLPELGEQSLSLAIANPATAPYGRAAQAVLGREEFAAAKGRKLVRGNNVLQAYQFWRSGAVDLALVARSLAPGESTPVPLAWYPVLAQHALVVSDHPALAAYLDWFRSDTVRSLILDAGYQSCP
mgnify:CR=1 FL=1